MKTFFKAGPHWSGFFILSLLLSGLTLTGCQSGAPKEEITARRPPRTDGPTRSYLQLTKSEARAKARQMGLRSRIVREDFETFPITKDLRQDRVNFEIDKGYVTAAKIF